MLINTGTDLSKRPRLLGDLGELSHRESVQPSTSTVGGLRYLAQKSPLNTFIK